LALDEQAWMLEQSVTLRSKHSAAPTWQRRLKKGGWITHLSGRILKPSQHQNFVEKYTESLEGIHASRSAVQASDKEKKTQDTYGHTSSSTSGQLDLFGAFSRTSKVTPRWGYGESCPIWKKKVTERRGVYSQRKKLALHTKGNECSSWPTATSRDWKDSMGNVPPSRQKECKQTLGQRVAHWATPQASDHIEGARTAKESNQKCLGRDLNQMNWPTPRAGNPGSRKPGTGGKILAEEAKNHAGPPAPEKSNTSGKNHGSWPTASARDWKDNGTTKPNSIGKTRGFSLGQKMVETSTPGKLNPDWVEQLMGLEVGWTQLPTEWIVSDS